jgi:hypothetical protein
MAEISEIRDVTLRGVKQDVSWESYRAIPAMNPSTLVSAIRGRSTGGELQISMKHLRYAWDNGRKDSASMVWGRALHSLIFEPNDFESRYIPWDGIRRGAKYKKFIADSGTAGTEVLTASEYKSVIMAAKSLTSDPEFERQVAPYLTDDKKSRVGSPEVTLLSEEGTIQVKGRLDWMRTAHSPAILDLKTTRGLQRFGRDFFTYHYDIKLGLYQKWARDLLGGTWPVVVLALENEPPYDWAMIPIADSVLEAGVEKAQVIFEALERCLDTDVWPGMAGDSEYFLDAPSWVMDEEPEWDV